ncbi:hypothetical protein D3Y57_02745 (plasmid) [Sphingomonas paeninsulae]|uniref:Lysozyme inhibitor LprI N-terminal domain-containing protein n=1 Tax=Sphingomonas paeninsulae TaxID=2319844 RepID=A0A494THT2_SPHPE|nr:hypothetical protein [Sphingomonas paeninsulae]AYJ84988.1 hypothetical protein D3Y57_02745 [Sphingomonas paeninsulae]
MIALLHIVVATAAQALPVPPPAIQWTADCARPTYATDMLVCGDPELRSMDQNLARMLENRGGDETLAPWIEGQADWFRRSRMCAFQADHRECLTAAYSERALVLSLLTSLPRPLGHCRLQDGGSSQVAEVQGAAILTSEGRTIGVETSDTGAWMPFLRYVRKGRRAVFRALDGKQLAVCRFDNQEEKQ